MRIKTRSFSRSQHYVEIDGQDFETDFEAIDWADILFHREGNKAVFAYLVQDTDPVNPMKEFDGQGVIYTRGNNNVITDDLGAMLDALELDGSGGVDWDKVATIDGIRCSLAEHVVDGVFKDLNIEEVRAHLLWLSRHDTIELSESTYKELADSVLSDEQVFELRDLHAEEMREDLLDDGGFHSALMGGAVNELYAEHWEAIAGPWVLPIHYSSERGSTSIGLTTWDGDPDYLPDGVWIADRSVIGNLPDPAAPEFKERITEYAASVLKEYEDWCCGNVFGCVLQRYALNEEGEWELEKDGDWDSCWGFIGLDLAQQTLRDEFFESAVKRLQNEVTNQG